MKKNIIRGQEEFIIIKNHHEPIISREIFMQANKILDERSLSQKEKINTADAIYSPGKLNAVAAAKAMWHDTKPDRTEASIRHGDVPRPQSTEPFI